MADSMEFSRLTSKGQMTIPKRVRTAVGLQTGDVLTVEVDDGVITMRKLKAGDSAYLEGLRGSLAEWAAPEDEDAWRDL
jgi:antitoxin PrlF